jgi:hypothetical protein
VKEDDGQDRDRTEAVDLAPVGVSGGRRVLGTDGYFGYRCQNRLASDAAYPLQWSDTGKVQRAPGHGR